MKSEISETIGSNTVPDRNAKVVDLSQAIAEGVSAALKELDLVKP